MREKFITSLFFFVAAFFLLFSPVQAGSLSKPDTGGLPGSWTVGVKPERIDPNKPVILFVHGLNSSATTWYDTNNMYETAQSNGFETAFIDLHDVTGTPENMWDNGALLAEKIKEISNHFGKKVVIVAHSKGGVDTQTALVHYGAYPYVSNVITLASPHHGTQLADLAYSSWAGWLANVIGYKSSGVESMQTSYMSYFRSITDSHGNSTKNNYYTFTGYNRSGYLFSGLYLKAYGDNDGVVTVESAHLPTGEMVQIGDWNHANIHSGTSTFNLIHPYLVSTSPVTAANTMTQANASTLKLEDIENDTYLRGGEYTGEGVETFAVEDGVQALNLDWLNSTPVKQLELIAPDGSVEQLKVRPQKDQDIFKGAWHHQAKITKPMAGNWTIKAKSTAPAAYFFTALFETKEPKIKMEHRAGEKKLKLYTDKLNKHRTNVNYTVDYYQAEDKPAKAKQKEGRQQHQKLLGKRIIQNKRTSSALPEVEIPNEGQGVYNITTEIESETTKGYKYHRTIVKSIYVDEKGNTFSEQ